MWHLDTKKILYQVQDIEYNPILSKKPEDRNWWSINFVQQSTFEKTALDRDWFFRVGVMDIRNTEILGSITVREAQKFQNLNSCFGYLFCNFIYKWYECFCCPRRKIHGWLEEALSLHGRATTNFRNRRLHELKIFGYEIRIEFEKKVLCLESKLMVLYIAYYILFRLDRFFEYFYYGEDDYLYDDGWEEDYF